MNKIKSQKSKLVDIHDLIRHLGLKKSRPLRKRYSILRRRILKKQRWAKTRKEIFQLNILPDELDADVSTITIEEQCERDPQRRELRTQVEDLQQSLQTMQKELEQCADERESVAKEREQILKEQEQERLKAKDCAERNIFLTSHIATMESEVCNKQREVDRLQADNQQLRQEKERSAKPYGQKRLSECGPDAVNKTKQAYKKQWGEKIDKFGEKRGLVLEKMVLKDSENGERLEVNMKTQPKYEELDPHQRKQLENMSRWKDKERVADKAYASLGNIADVPCASHVKAHEKELNSQIGNITTVQ